MAQAIGFYEDIKTIERNFNTEDVIIRMKIEMLEERYAYTVTQLAKLLMEGVSPICTDGGIGGISFPKTDRP
jgi:hypothetical protein